MKNKPKLEHAYDRQGELFQLVWMYPAAQNALRSLKDDIHRLESMSQEQIIAAHRSMILELKERQAKFETIVKEFEIIDSADWSI